MPTFSNIADGTSREDFSVIFEMGGQRVFLPYLAVERALGLYKLKGGVCVRGSRRREPFIARRVGDASAWNGIQLLCLTVIELSNCSLDLFSDPPYRRSGVESITAYRCRLSHVGCSRATMRRTLRCRVSHVGRQAPCLRRAHRCRVEPLRLSMPARVV